MHSGMPKNFSGLQSTSRKSKIISSARLLLHQSKMSYLKLPPASFLSSKSFSTGIVSSTAGQWAHNKIIEPRNIRHQRQQQSANNTFAQSDTLLLNFSRFKTESVCLWTTYLRKLASRTAISMNGKKEQAKVRYSTKSESSTEAEEMRRKMAGSNTGVEGITIDAIRELLNTQFKQFSEIRKEIKEEIQENGNRIIDSIVL